MDDLLTSETTFYTIGDVGYDETCVVDTVEEWSVPLKDVVQTMFGVDTLDAAKAVWERDKPHFKYSPGRTRVLKVTITVEEVEVLAD